MLQFFGRGSAFAEEHNSAFFCQGKDLVLIDCPSDAFRKAKKMNLEEMENIYILITHTHGDHCESVGTMLQYAWFALHRPVTVVAPSKRVKEDLLALLVRIEGCEPEWFRLAVADEIQKEWLIAAIPTVHTEPLSGRCFGYHLVVKGTDVVYTGDTATLEPFLPLLHKGAYFYTEAAFCPSDVHLTISDALPVLKELSAKGVKVFLMHLDREDEIAKLIQDTDLEFAPLYLPE